MKYVRPHLMRWKYVAGSLAILIIVVTSYTFFANISTHLKDTSPFNVQVVKGSPTTLSSPVSGAGVMLPAKPATGMPTSTPEKEPTANPAIGSASTPPPTPAVKTSPAATSTGTTATPDITPTATSSASTYPGMHLLWNEEFDESSLDAGKWNVQDNGNGYQSCCLYDGQQYYTPGNVVVQNGLLRLLSQKRDLGGKHYTSGAVTTEKKFSFLYGRIDVRARLPISKGYWPAIWLLSEGNEHNEIDLMELLGKDPALVYLTTHQDQQQIDQYLHSVQGTDYSQGFHTFSLLWTASSLTFYIDGQQVGMTTRAVPHQRMYLLICTAIGDVSDWPGAPDASSRFPQYNDTDYVRVYQ
jgi:beta-glucanase (GH16 family)